MEKLSQIELKRRASREGLAAKTRWGRQEKRTHDLAGKSKRTKNDNQNEQKQRRENEGQEKQDGKENKRRTAGGLQKVEFQYVFHHFYPHHSR